MGQAKKMWKKHILALFAIILASITTPLFACQKPSLFPQHVEIHLSEWSKDCYAVKKQKKKEIQFINNTKKILDEDYQIEKKAIARFRVRSKSLMFTYKIDWQ